MEGDVEESPNLGLSGVGERRTARQGASGIALSDGRRIRNKPRSRAGYSWGRGGPADANPEVVKNATVSWANGRRAWRRIQLRSERGAWRIGAKTGKRDRGNARGKVMGTTPKELFKGLAPCSTAGNRFHMIQLELAGWARIQVKKST